MQFVFPDSGRKVELDSISFMTLSLLRGHYENTYPNKPTEPKNPLDTIENGDVNSESFQEANKQYKIDKDLYETALTVWKEQMGKAQWAATKLLYARHLKEIDTDAVEYVVQEMSEFGMDLRESIREGYRELNVPLPEPLLDKYIYLFHVCITNQSEQALFTNFVFSGSAPSQEAVREAFFRLRNQV